MTERHDTVRFARSLLFVPATHEARLDKALACADLVVADLEDAVAPGDKAAARRALSERLQTGQPRLAVRINPPDTAEGSADLAVLAEAAVAAWVIPKTSRAADLDTVRRAVGASAALLPVVETPVGLARCSELAAAAGVERLIFGTLDLALELGMDFTSTNAEAAIPGRFQVALASATAAIGTPVDGPTTALHDEALVRAEAQRAKELGFGGKACLHPDQIRPVHSTFSPTEEEAAAARRVVEAAADDNEGVFALDGRMVDRPVIDHAHYILQLHERYTK